MQAHSSIPQHIAIIMDGNRRWAKQHKLQALQGHSYVANKVIKPLVVRCIERGIKVVTLWAFSTENWRRDPQEVQGLMNLLRDAFDKNASELHELGVRLQTIGDLRKFPPDIQESVQKWKDISQNNSNITVVFALNYGGRDEIIRAVNQLERPVSTEAISGCLDTAGLPDPDLLIRPGGEQRLSGFMPWQTVYTELYFTDVLMPDFSPAELDIALEEYAQRHRRFGS